MAAKVEVQHIVVTAHRALKLAAQIPIVAGDIEVDAVTFEFEEEEDWQDLSLLAYFTNSASGITENAEYTRGDELKIPQAVTQDVGYIGVALLGVDIDNTDPENPVFIQRAATQACPNLLRVYQSGVVVYDPDPQSPIAPNILEQLNQTLAAAVAATQEAEHSISQHNDPFVGADEDTAGDKGLVPAPAAGEQDLVLFGSGEWRDVNEVLDLDNKADIDGYYELLTAGAADNLTGRGDSVEGSFIYRTAGGDADIADGIATIECIKGNTVGWNQLCNNKTTMSYTEFNSYMSSTNTPNLVEWECVAEGLPLSGTSNGFCGGVSFGCTAGDGWCFKNGHVYIISLEIKCSAVGRIFHPCLRGKDHGLETENAGSLISFSNLSNHVSQKANTWEKFRFRHTVNQDRKNMAMYRQGRSDTFEVGETWAYRNFQIFDLTEMFGAGNEPATVEEFEALYPEPYYPTNLGELKPAQFEGVETIGFNQWDEEWESGMYSAETGAATGSSSYIRSKNPIDVFPNTTYSMTKPSAPGIHLYYYDTAMNYIGHVGQVAANSTTRDFTTPANCRYVNFAIEQTAYNNDIAIHLKWSGYRDGEYEEYWKAQREIAIAQHFPTGMKAAGTAADMLYKDHADHVVGEVDLGTLTWYRKTASSGYAYFYATLSSTRTYGELWCLNYASVNTVAGFATDKTILLGSMQTHGVYIHDNAYAEATGADFKTAMSGVILYFELADSAKTTEVIDPPLNLGYKVSDFGTERVMLADGVISAPPIFEISYGLNAVDTIRRLPTEYISHDSFEQFTSAMVTSFDVGITESWDSVNERYSYVITPSQTTTDADVMNIVNEEWEG